MGENFEFFFEEGQPKTTAVDIYKNQTNFIFDQSLNGSIKTLQPLDVENLINGHYISNLAINYNYSLSIYQMLFIFTAMLLLFIGIVFVGITIYHKTFNKRRLLKTVSNIKSQQATDNLLVKEKTEFSDNIHNEIVNLDQKKINMNMNGTTSISTNKIVVYNNCIEHQNLPNSITQKALQLALPSGRSSPKPPEPEIINCNEQQNGLAGKYFEELHDVSVSIAKQPFQKKRSYDGKWKI